MVSDFSAGKDRRSRSREKLATLVQTRKQTLSLYSELANQRPFEADEITVLSGYEGPAYGVPDQQTVDAIHIAARTEGMLTDPVYEGKSMAGLIDRCAAAGSPPARACCTVISVANPRCRPMRVPRGWADRPCAT